MRLDEVTVGLRPRSPWEATDLGLAMTQAWWRAVYPPFLLAVAAVYGAASLLLWSSPGWVPVVVWWLKPLFDRLLLHVYSQALFGAVPQTRQTLRAVPGLLGNGLWRQLSVLRFDTIRSFRTPVLQLENLRGRALRDRLRVLARRGRSHAAGLTLVCVHMDVFLVMGGIALVALMTPAGVDFDVFTVLNRADGGAALLWNLLLMTGFLVVEPLYVAAGFALYLNRRTELEGWDIELRLRRIAGRLAGVVGTAALVLVIVLTTPAGAWAAIEDRALHDGRRPAAESATVIGEVLADEAFDTTRTFTTWRWRGEPEPDDEEPPDLTLLGEWMLWIARAVEGLLWGLLAGLVIAAVYYGRRWYLGRDRAATVIGAADSPLAFGTDTAGRPLPADIPAAADDLWQRGEHRAALSLLYRGSLKVMGGGLARAPRDSETEGEVLRSLRGRLPEYRYGYLVRVTRLWLAVAYARQVPAAPEFAALVQEWPAAAGEAP